MVLKIFRFNRLNLWRFGLLGIAPVTVALCLGWYLKAQVSSEGMLDFVEKLWMPSPNFDSRPDGVLVDTVVLHATVIDSLEKTTEFFEKVESKVSAHFTVGKDGTVVQHVREGDRAWHAGSSRMQDGRESVNDFSIGIEIVNKNDGNDPYPDEQIEALRSLIMELKSRHPIRYVVTHAEIATPIGRKNDPLGFFVKWVDNWI